MSRSVPVHGRVTGFFGGYGAFVVRHPAAVFMFGVLILVIMSFGNVLNEEELTLDELWTVKGTRLSDEREQFESAFGGLPRKQFVAIRDTSSAQNVAQEQHLNALLTSLQDLQTLSVTVDDASKTVTSLCERPPVPPVLAASTVSVSNKVVRSYAAFFADLTRQMSLTNQLPTDWVIDEFPCSRTTVLDCFREGEFDYPANLKSLDKAASELVARMTTGGDLASVSNILGVDVTLSGGVTFRATESGFFLELRASLSVEDTQVFMREMWGLFLKMMSWGYSYRPEYQKFNSSAEILAHINAGVARNRDLSADALPVACALNGDTDKAPCCVTWSVQKIPEQLIFGDTVGSPGSYSRIGATRATMNHYNSDHPQFVDSIGLSTNTAKERLQLMLSYEDKIIEKLKPKWERTNVPYIAAFPNARLDFLTARSPDDAIREGSDPESTLMIVGLVIMWVYVSIVLSRIQFPYTGNSAVYGRVGLGTAGMLVLILSTVAGFGLTSLFAVDLSPISTNLVPFLSIGIGIDDMFVLVSTLSSFNTEKTVVRRMKLTLGVAGPAIMLTSLTNAAAFLIAGVTPIDAVRSFVLQMGITAACNFFALLFVFVPLLVWDAQRTNEKRADICVMPCTHLSGRVKEEADFQPKYSIRRFAEKSFGPCLTVGLSKILLIMTFFIFFAATATIAFTSTESGFRLSDIALKDTYTRDYVDLQETKFGAYDAFLVTRGDHATTAVQKGLLDVQNALQTDSSFIVGSTKIRDLAWNTNSSTSLYAIVQATSPSFDINSDTIPPSVFETNFTRWIASVGAIYGNDVHCRNADTKQRVSCFDFSPTTDEIMSTKSIYFNENLFEHDDLVDSIKNDRRIVDSVSASNVFAYGYVFKFWSQYIDLTNLFYEISGWALLGVFTLTFAFLFSPGASFLICIVVLKGLIEVYGFMTLLGIKLNAFSVGNLIASTAFSIEFSAHVTHVFLVMHGTRDERVVSALREMLPPMVHGAVTTFLAVLLLSQSKFPFFRLYYFGMFGIICVITFLNCLVFLPVMLSLFGPRSLHDRSADKLDRPRGVDDQPQGLPMERIGSMPDQYDENGDLVVEEEDEEAGEIGERG